MQDNPSYFPATPCTHIAYKCWFCGVEHAFTWPKTLHYEGAKKRYTCTLCGHSVVGEFLGLAESSNIPRIRVSFDTLMWVPHRERTAT